MSEEGHHGWSEDDLGVRECTRCPALVESRSQIVNGVGPGDAELLFVGEAPGATEDEEGEPFVGRSGGVLDEALREAGLSRADVRITNCVRCRPPENRDPTAEERAQCRGFLEREIAAIDPSLVVTLGKVPAEHLLERAVAVTTEAETIESITVDERSIPVLICVHPAATLYDPGQREPFESAIRRASEYAGANGQSTFDSFE